MFILGPYIGVGLPLPADGTPWSPSDLFGDLAGFWAGGYAPAPFTPELLFPEGGDGYWAGGYAPDPFSPALLFPTGGAGHWSGGYAPDPS